MKLRLLLAVFFAASLCAAYGMEEPPPEKKPGMMSRVLNIFRGSKEPGGPAGKATWKRLVLTLKVEPAVVKLPETRRLKVTLQVANKGKRLVQLEFPTTQRIEVLLRRQDGKLVEQWSEDQAFANELTMVAVNPGERLEYTVSVATRDLTPGEVYTVEAFFPNYEQLKAAANITPER